jgi:hypothetical protein
MADRNIVEKLRDAGSCVFDGELYCEAADEIERLRGQLRLTERARDAMAIRFGLMAEE